MSHYADVVHAQVRAFTGNWSDGQTVDVLSEMRALAIRSTIVTMFSRRELGAEIGVLREAVTGSTTRKYATRS